LIARAETGWTETSAFRTLPASLRFFAGGDQSVRGYALQELGPRDEEDNVIGGEALLVGSVELDRLFFDFDRFGRWGAAVFYDVGGAARDFGDSLESGAGAGIRWLSPIGLVRLDAAWALSRPGAPIRFHVGVGPDF
jgi:translocation and assembly module TamA